jgi:hypothetical protein
MPVLARQGSEMAQTTESRRGGWLAPVAVTASYWLRRELDGCAHQAGVELDYTDLVVFARRQAHRRPMIIIGADVTARIRRPVRCGGLVIVAALDVPDAAGYAHAARISADYVIALPLGGPWLAERLHCGPAV